MSEDIEPESVQKYSDIALEAINIAVASLWIATCAVAPEFIWRGVSVVLHHANWADLGVALLVGLILACYVEPVLKRLHLVWTKEAHHAAKKDAADNLLFTFGVGLVFALASYVIHDAVTGFLASHEENQTARMAGLVTGLTVASSWTIVPFLVTVAWLNAGRKWLRWPLAFLALCSPAFAAWEFSWSVQDWISTQIPCTVILGLGYRHWPAGPANSFFRRCAKSLLWICPLWLTGALLFDQVMALLRLSWIHFYNPTEAWIDFRFYFGWISGLLLAPVPRIKQDPKPA